MGLFTAQEYLDPNIMLRKGIYDKVAAKVILQRYLDFYHDLSLD